MLLQPFMNIKYYEAFVYDFKNVLSLITIQNPELYWTYV